MKQTLLLLLFSLPFSLVAMDEDIIIEPAAMSESEMIEGCNKLEQDLQKRKEQIKQLQDSFKDTDTIITTFLHEGREYESVVASQDTKHQERVKKYKDYLNDKIKSLECNSKSIVHLLSMIDIGSKLPKEQIDNLRTYWYVKSLNDQRDEYERLLKSVSKDKELYEKDYLMKAIPAESQSEKKNDN